MPIEIKELNVRVQVTSPQSRHNMNNYSSVSKNNNQEDNSIYDKEEIVSECIEQVLQILQDKGER